MAGAPSSSVLVARSEPLGNLHFLAGGNSVGYSLGELIAALVEGRKPCFGQSSSFIAGTAICNLLRNCAGKNCVAGLSDVLSRFRNLSLTVADATEHEGDAGPGNSLLDHFMGQENRWLEIIQGKASRENYKVARFRNAEGPGRRMRRPIENQEVIMRCHSERLLHRTEPLDRDGGLHGVLEPPSLPIEACTLGDVEVCDLDVPSVAGELTGSQASKGRLPYPALLRNHADDHRHTGTRSLKNDLKLGRNDDRGEAVISVAGIRTCPSLLTRGTMATACRTKGRNTVFVISA